MSTRMLIVAAAIGTSLFGKVDLPNIFHEPLPTMVCYRYDSSMEETHKEIGPNDAEYKILSDFINENNTSWEYDVRSYAPNILFKTSIFTINILKDGVIINYQDLKGEWRQISKSCKKPFYELSGL